MAIEMQKYVRVPPTAEQSRKYREMEKQVKDANDRLVRLFPGPYSLRWIEGGRIAYPVFPPLSSPLAAWSLVHYLHNPENTLTVPRRHGSNKRTKRLYLPVHKGGAVTTAPCSEWNTLPELPETKDLTFMASWALLTRPNWYKFLGGHFPLAHTALFEGHVAESDHVA